MMREHGVSANHSRFPLPLAPLFSSSPPSTHLLNKGPCEANLWTYVLLISIPNPISMWNPCIQRGRRHAFSKFGHIDMNPFSVFARARRNRDLLR